MLTAALAGDSLRLRATCECGVSVYSQAVFKLIKVVLFIGFLQFNTIKANVRLVGCFEIKLYFI